MARRPRSIIIVGGGLSGIVLAANLLRRARRPLDVLLLERAPQLGGVAYAARDYPYLLNVPVARMSADSRRPEAFLEFARRRAPATGAEDFVPRSWYGDYLRAMLTGTEAGASAARLQRVQGEAAHLSRDGAGLRVALRDGRILRADEVVLACGNPPPSQLPAFAALAGHPRYVADGCRETSLQRMPGEVLLVGTGLTMADAALAASARGAQRVFAISRHGLVPPPQTAGSHAVHDLRLHAHLAGTRTPRALLRLARDLVREHEAAGGDWRSVVNGIREHAPALWRGFDGAQRRQFLRHLRAYWDVHRHRLPASTSERLGVLREAGRLHVHAGRIVAARADEARLQVTWQPRGAKASQTLTVEWIVNCTGPDYDLRRSRDPMFRAAIRDGLLVPDDCGLGLRTGEHGALLNAGGGESQGLYCLGPMLRAHHWETTAVAELRTHAEALATHLLDDAVSGSRPVAAWSHHGHMPAGMVRDENRHFLGGSRITTLR